MSGPRACDSCSGDTAFERRVRCARCGGQVHQTCRDDSRICYYCRWIEGRRSGEYTELPSPTRPNPKDDD